MDTEGPRHAEVTPDDHGALIQIPAWFLMVVMILVTFLKITIRFKATRNPGLDDALVVIGMVFAVGETISISLGVNNGLGQRQSIRDNSLAVSLQKDIYAGSILYIFSIAVVKIAAVTFISRLVMKKVYVRVLWALMAVVVLWGVAAALAFAFQCGLSTPWNSSQGQCFDIVPYWQAIGAIDIATDFFIILIPQYLVWNLQMSKGKKAIVSLAFGSRVIVMVAAILRLIYLKQLSHSADYLFDVVGFVTITQCQLAFNVLATCLPSLKPFLDRTASGMLNVSIAPRSGTTYGLGSHNAYQMGKVSNNSKTSRQASKAYNSKGSASPPKSINDPGEHNNARNESFRPERNIKHTTFVTSDNKMQNSRIEANNHNQRDDLVSIESSSGSEKMIVRLRTDLSVHYSDEEPMRRDNVSSGTITEHVHQDAVHARSPV